MDDLIKKIRARSFEEAKEQYLSSDITNSHNQIIEHAYKTDDIAFSDFYDYLIDQEPTNAFLHYCMAELYTTVFNILPGGYQKAFYHAKKAIVIAEDDLSYKEFILLFYQIPERLLSREEAINYAREILEKDPNNRAAKTIVSH